MRRLLFGLVLLGWMISPSLVSTAFISTARAELHVYPAAEHGQGSLRMINGLPVLTVRGTPEEIGEQMGVLTAPVVKELVDFPLVLAKALRTEKLYPVIVRVSQGMQRHSPPAHLKELKACAKSAGVDLSELFAANVMPDTYRAFGCSSLMIDADQSATGGPLFGRNLDYFALGNLHKYSLVTVYHPEGKRSFASIGFPGLIGCLSGMNDAGLALAVHEVYKSKDGSSIFNGEGVPYTMVFRRILEECTTVAEAEKLLRSVKRTTLLNLAICTPTESAVIELSPKSVVVRRGNDGVCACTNHFRSDDLALSKACFRYPKLTANFAGKVTVAEVAKRLDAANQRRSTLQTMLFEPATLKLHLSIGELPSSAHPMKLIDLKPLLMADEKNH